MEISGKIMVITGAGSGIGAALAKAAAAAGARVVVSDRDFAAAQAVADTFGGLAVACDVTSESKICALVDTVEATLGSVDIFVSNAGLGRGDPSHAASAPDEDWQLNWQVHVMAHVWAARRLLPYMIKRKTGYFVNVASAAGLLNQIGDAAYSATKHAAVSFAESLHIGHADDGIGVSVVCPQYVATPLIGLSDADAEGRETLLTADDVARCILEGVSADKFMILTHPQVAGFVQLRAADPERWLVGMRGLKAKAIAKLGSASPQEFYKLV